MENSLFYTLLFLLSLFLTFCIRNYAIKKSLVVIPNDRSSHTTPIPHGGGVAIAVTWFIGLFYLYMNEQIDSQLFFALLAGGVIAIVSYLDDLYELSPFVRLVTQSSVAIGGLVALGGLNSLDFGLFSIQNQFVTNLVAFVAIIWFINLYNFLDGIDGYAGSEALFLALAGFVFFGDSHFLILALSVSGFLVWNWHKAKIFMGDVGSTLLGYNVAIFTIYYANAEATNLWVWIILFGLFWFDATLTLLRRYKNSEKLSQAHKKHAYQRLTQSGFKHDKVVLLSILVNLVLFCTVYFVQNILVAFCLAILILSLAVKYVDNKKGFL